jgi:hypothetical protein
VSDRFTGARRFRGPLSGDKNQALHDKVANDRRRA